MKNPIHHQPTLMFSRSLKSIEKEDIKKMVSILFCCLFSFSGIAQDSVIADSKAKFKRGIFKTFKEFKNNEPTFEHPFYVDTKERKRKNWKGTTSYIPRFTESDQKIKKVWGFCDGTTVYVYHQKEFFPIDMDDNNLNFFGYGYKKGSSKGGEKMMKVGLQIASVAAYDPTYIVGAGIIILSLPIIVTGGIVAISTSSSHKKHKVEYSIDSINGKIH